MLKSFAGMRRSAAAAERGIPRHQLSAFFGMSHFTSTSSPFEPSFF
jgi:hypothetical protein